MNANKVNYQLSEFHIKLKELKQTLFPNKEGEVWLYGSRARGDNQVDSDWDLIVLTEENDNFNNFKKYAFPFVQLGVENGQDVIPLLYSKEEWKKEAGTIFYNNVLADRISI